MMQKMPTHPFRQYQPSWSFLTQLTFTCVPMSETAMFMQANRRPFYHQEMQIPGSIIYPTGEGLCTIHERKRHQEVAAHLKLLLEWQPGVFFFVVMDNASAHTTPKLDSFKDRNKGHLETVYLPTYSPNLNPIERVWRFMRGQITRNQFYSTLKNLAQAVVDWFRNIPISQFCSVLGVDDLNI